MEEPLPAYGSCNLFSINLSEFVIHKFTDKAYFDYIKFDNTVRQSVKYMNEILNESIEKNMYPLEEQKQMVIDWRQIGIGIMGLADMLIKMGIKYGDRKSIEICDSIGKCMINSALQQSAILASKYGTYPKYNKEFVLKSEYLKTVSTEETYKMIEEYGLRNSQLLTIAPTGSISTMLGISGGIEPIYELSYTRKTETLHEEDTFYKVYTPIVQEFMEKFKIKDESELPDYFVTAMTLNPFERIDMQAIWQKYIDASISSTINLPYATSSQTIEDLYYYAWSNGLKGCTIYRDGCKRTGILTIDNENNKAEKIDGVCQECGKNALINSGGCKICMECGWSPCS